MQINTDQLYGVSKKAQEEITQRVAGRMQNKLRGKEYNRLLVVIFMLHKDVLPEIKKNSESMKEDDCKIRKTYFKRFKCRRLNLVSIMAYSTTIMWVWRNVFV